MKRKKRYLSKRTGDDEKFKCMECGKLINTRQGITTLSGRWVCDNKSCRWLDDENDSHDLSESRE